MKQPLSIVRGTTKTVSISVDDGTGKAYSLGSSEVLRFGVKKHPGDTVYLISKEMSADSLSDGAYMLMLTPADTEELQFGHYYYDVGLQSGTSYYNIIECSDFIVEYNITNREV